MNKRIVNIRLGFATNSSSSHSIVFLKDDAELPISNDDSYEYGWDFFTISKENTKLHYLAIILRGILYNTFNQKYTKLSETNCKIIVEKLLKVYLNISSTIDSIEGYIDHQSQVDFIDFSSKKNYIPTFESVKKVKDLLLKERVLILGGNDNSDYNHPLLENAKQVFEKELELDFSCIFKYDFEYNFVSIFNTKTGDKVRIDLADIEDEVEKLQKDEAYNAYYGFDEIDDEDLLDELMDE